MSEPITFPIRTDPEDIVQMGFDYMRARVPGWDPDRGDAVTWLLRACSFIIAEGRDVASDVPLAILRYMGRWLVGVLPIDAQPAQTTATVTFINTAGYTIPAGTRFLVATSGDEGQVFYTPAAVVVAPGSATTSVGGVLLIAETPGTAATGLSSASAVSLVDEVFAVDTITLTANTTGGVDAETDDQYLARLVDELTLLTPRPILPEDFAILAHRVAGVGRSLALDGYNPADSTFNNERMIAIAVTDSAGLAASAGIKSAVDALLEAMREVSFVVNVIDPTYTTIDVTYVGVAVPGYDAPTVKTAVDAAITSFLSPMTWGNLIVGSGVKQTGWVNVSSVRNYELAEAINAVLGFQYITSLSFGKRQNVTGANATDIVTATAHGFVQDEPIVFRALVGGAGLTSGTTYFARTITANTFQVAATVGGAAINFTTDITAGTVTGMTNTDVALPGAAPLPLAGVITGTVT